MPEFIRDGAILHYECEGSGIPVICINGFGAHSNDIFSTQFRKVMGEQFLVLSVDNRGSGQTQITEPDTPVTIETMADDIAALIDHLGLEKVHVLGISMGGCIGMALALRHPEKVKSQVIVVSFAAMPPSSRAGFLQDTRREMLDNGVPRSIITRLSAIILLGESIFQYDGLMDAFMNAPLDPYEQTPEGFKLQREALKHFDVRSVIPSITIPTLVMSSPEDVLVPPHYQDEIANLIPGAQIKRYPGGHIFFVLPMYAAEFIDDVRSFWLAHES